LRNLKVRVALEVRAHTYPLRPVMFEVLRIEVLAAGGSAAH